MLLAAALASVAIVTQDQAALRNAPRDAAAPQAVLWQGDLLEIRGQRVDYLQVYDHRRERAGYVLASQVRTTSLTPAEAPELLAVTRFLRDTPGSEALGIAYAAAYLKAAPAGTIGAEPFDAITTMAERLARRAAQKQGSDATAAARLDIAAAYGVQFKSYAQGDAIRLCYDGDAARRVYTYAPTPEQAARAALALTRHDCVDPALRPLERAQIDEGRAELLDRLDAAAELPGVLKNRLHLRRAGVWSAIAYERARRADNGMRQAAQRAIDELAAVDKNELTDDDNTEYIDAAIRVGASRWAADLPVAAGESVRASIVTEPGEPGQTCVLLVDAQHGRATPLVRRCTYGVAWTASASTSPDGRAVALAVQPLATWRELWVFRAQGDGWTLDVLPPAAADPELGYIEFAGWVPGGDKMLLAREARIDGRARRSFEVTNLATLAADKQASTPSLLALFGKWQDPAWKRSTVSVR